jgi:hypothetical protein
VQADYGHVNAVDAKAYTAAFTPKQTHVPDVYSAGPWAEGVRRPGPKCNNVTHPLAWATSTTWTTPSAIQTRTSKGGRLGQYAGQPAIGNN